MLEIYLDKRGEVAIENIEALMKAFPEYAERAIASSLKSEGWRLRGLIKQAIKNGGVDGEWEKLNPHTGIVSQAKKKTVKNFRLAWKGKKGSKKRVREYKGSILSTRRNPLLKLAGAVRYNYDKDLQLVDIGFIQSPGVAESMLKLAGMHAEGFSTRITPKLRKMMFGLGFPLKKSTKTLESPPRPVVEPVFEQEEDNIYKNIELNFLKALARYLEAE